MLCGLDAHCVLTDLSTLLDSYKESPIPVAKVHQPELMFLHEVVSGSVCVMNVVNYSEKNLRWRA